MKCLNNKNKLIKIKKMKTKEIKLKTVKPVKTVPVKKTVESDILPEPAILENNKTLDYKLRSGRVISAPCADEFFSSLSRRAKIEYLEFCVRNDLKLSDLQDNFC